MRWAWHPHDPVAVSAALNGTVVATLPAETYAAINLQPGAYTLATSEPASGSTSDAGANPVLTVAAGETRFVYTSVPTRTSDSLATAFAGRAGSIPLLVPVTTRAGQRTWHECTELDARG